MKWKSRDCWSTSVAATDFCFVHRVKGAGLVLDNTIDNVGKLFYIGGGVQLTSWKSYKILVCYFLFGSPDNLSTSDVSLLMFLSTPFHTFNLSRTTDIFKQVSPFKRVENVFKQRNIKYFEGEVLQHFFPS